MKFAICFIFLCLFSFFSSAQLLEKILAIVEENMITLSELKNTKRRMRSGMMKDSSLLPLFKESDLKKKDSILLKYLIYEKLLDTASLNTPFQINDAQIKQEIVQKRKRRFLSQRGFSRFLVRNGFTFSSYKKFLKKSLLRKALIQKEIINKIKISDTDLNEYAIKKGETPLFTSFEYELSYLFFPPNAEGEKEAQETLKKLEKDHAAFDQFTAKVKGSKKKSLGKKKLSSVNPKIREAVQNLSVSQHSSLVTLPSGYHIFRVNWKTPIITLKNQKRRGKILNLLFKDLFKRQMESWLKKREKQAFIQINS